MDDTVIPPVSAGTLSSSIETEHKANITRRSDPQKRVVATHEWTFDSQAYAYETGLDLGADYPWVPQGNGHTLCVRRDFTWNPAVADTDNDTWYTMRVEERWYTQHRANERVRHSEYRIEVDEDGGITRFDDEAFDFRGGRVERFDPRFSTTVEDGTIFEGAYAGTPMELVRTIHFGQNVYTPTVTEQIQYLLDEDSPDDAVPAREYEYTGTYADEQPTPADVAPSEAEGAATETPKSGVTDD